MTVNNFFHRMLPFVWVLSILVVILCFPFHGCIRLKRREHCTVVDECRPCTNDKYNLGLCRIAGHPRNVTALLPTSESLSLSWI